jgi:hypothetical protein
MQGRGTIPAPELVSMLFEFSEAHPTSAWAVPASAPAPPAAAERGGEGQSDHRAAEGTSPSLAGGAGGGWAAPAPPAQTEGTAASAVDYGDVSLEPEGMYSVSAVD